MKHIFLIPLSVNALSGRTWRQKAERERKERKQGNKELKSH
jgi:hypothetical protein